MAAVKRSEPTKLSRKGRARATHWRIVGAAYSLFGERGYASGRSERELAEFVCERQVSGCVGVKR